MEHLSKTWLTDRHIDLEFKSYMLLAYLQEVEEKFTARKLYPHLAELIEHYHEALKLKHVSGELQENFPKELTGFDFTNFRLMYEKMLNDDQLMEEVIRTAEYSLPKFEQYITEGKQMYEMIEQKLHLEPVGLVPLNTFEGYLLLDNLSAHTTDVYEYQLTLFEKSNDKYRSMRTEFVMSYPQAISNTYQFIKSDLIRNYRTFHNPATYVIASEIELPVYESYLPIAKRLLIKYIST